jgi:hypothetical protein
MVFPPSEERMQLPMRLDAQRDFRYWRADLRRTFAKFGFKASWAHL